MKHTCLHRLAAAIVAATAVLAGMSAYADPVEDLVEFTAGTTARADEVNGNFSEVANAVNDNDARVAVLEAEIVELREQLSPEPFHIVGETGEPAFGIGGDGDCLWGNSEVLLPALGPVSFSKDSDRIVRLAGVARAVDSDSGGFDEICGKLPTQDEGDFSDNVIFVLPSGYLPEHLQIFPGIDPSGGGIIVVPEGGVILSGFSLPAGAVLAGSVEDETATSLDGITFRAATETTTSSLSREPANISLEALRGVLFD